MSEASSKGIAACQDADATCIYETNIIIPLASLHFASLRSVQGKNIRLIFARVKVTRIRPIPPLLEWALKARHHPQHKHLLHKQLQSQQFLPPPIMNTKFRLPLSKRSLINLCLNGIGQSSTRPATLLSPSLARWASWRRSFSGRVTPPIPPSLLKMMN